MTTRHPDLSLLAYSLAAFVGGAVAMGVVWWLS